MNICFIKYHISSIIVTADGPSVMRGVDKFDDIEALSTMTANDAYLDLQLFTLRAFVEGFLDDGSAFEGTYRIPGNPEKIRALAVKLLRKGAQEDYQTAMRFLRSRPGQLQALFSPPRFFLFALHLTVRS